MKTKKEGCCLQRETDETRHNVETFVSAPDLPSAKPLLQKVPLPSLPSPFFLSLTVTLSVGSRFTFHREIPPITLHRFLCPRFLDARHALPRSSSTTRIFRSYVLLLLILDARRRWEITSIESAEKGSERIQTFCCGRWIVGS